MPLDKQTLDRYAYGGKLKVEILDRYAYEPEAKKPLIGPQPAPKWWEKELRTAGEFVKFPYTISKEFTYPIAKGTARAIPALFTSREKAQKIAREEIEPAAMQGVEMGKAFGGGVLDWLKMSLLPDTPVGIVAKQRIGERIKEHGYLAEAIHPAVLAGLVKGGTKLVTKKPSPLAARLEAIKKSDIGVPRKVIDKRLGDIPEPELVRSEMQPILDQILQLPKKTGPKPSVPGEGVAKTARKLKAEGVGEEPTITKHFQRYTSEQRADRMASHRLGHRAKEAVGEYFYSNQIENIAYKTAKEAQEAFYAKRPHPAPAGKGISPKRDAELKIFADRSLDQVEAGKPAGRTWVWPEAGERGPIQPRITADASTYPQWYRDLTRDYSIKKSQTIKALKQIKEKGMEADGRQYVENVKASILEAMTKERSVYAQEILKERAKRGVLTPVEKELHDFFEQKGKAFSKALKLKEEVKAKPGGKQTNLMGLYDRALAEHEMAKPLKKVTGTKAIKEEILGRPEGEVLPGQQVLKPSPGKAAGKQPWEMTKVQAFEQWRKSVPEKYRPDETARPAPEFLLEHRKAVHDAFAKRKPVPKPVLAEYPELKAKTEPKVITATAKKITPKNYGDWVDSKWDVVQTTADYKKAVGALEEVYRKAASRGDIKGTKEVIDHISDYLTRQTKKENKGILGDYMQRALAAHQKLLTRLGAEYPELGKGGRIGRAKSALDLAEKKATERIKKRGTRLTAGIDPAEMADLAIIGAAKIAKGTIKFGEWSAEMVREYGVRVKPYLDEIWSRSQSQVKGARERGFVASTKEQFPEMRKKVAGQYIPRSTDDLAVKARNLIKDDIAKAEELVKTGTDESAVATAAELIKHYNERAQKGAGNEVFYSEAAKVANDMAVKLTDLGRAVQAASILGRLTPEGMLRFAAKEIQKWNIKHPTKRIKGLTSEQTKHILTESKRINEMAEGWQKGKAARDLQNYIGDLTPSPLWKKLINIWKAGLLTGIKTSGLNDMSNLFHGISETIKDVPAAGIDRVASLFTGKRTLGLTVRGVRGSIGEGFRKGWRYMKTGFDERNIAIKLDWKRVSFGKSRFARILQTYEQLVFRSMGAQDQPFYYGAKARSLASQAIAQAKNNKLKGAQVKRFIDNLIENPTDEMLKNAVNDAEISVFQNRTYLGEAGKAVQKIPGGEAVVPFARTPSAVATQLVNYSPVGIVKAIVGNIGKGKFNQRAFSQGLGRGIVGTGVIYIGTQLFKNDLMTLDYPKSEKERKLWEMEGRKANSIYFLGKWRNPNVFGPAGMALLVGGYFQQGIDETGSLWGGIAQGVAGGAKSLTDQTFLRGINQVTDALDDPSRFLTGYVTGTAGSVIPTIGGDIARATDPIVRRVESPLQGIQARIPGLRQGLEPRIQAVGGETPRRGTFLETMIDPTRPSGLKPTPVVRELRRLWDAGHRVSPTQLGNKKGYEGLTPQQNTKLWKVTGRLLEDKLGRLVVAPKYGSLSDEKKADLIDKVVGKVKLQVRIGVALKVIQGLDRDETIKKLRELKEGGLITKQIINDPTFQEGVKKQLTPTER